MRQYKRMLLIFPVLSVFLLNQPTQAYAWFFDFGLGEHHDRHEGYSEVVVGGERYYFNDGIYYSGAPGSYVVVEAPIGAIIYDVPAGFEEVDIDGDVYFRYHDVYYRHVGRGYQVVSRPHEHHHGGGRRRTA